MTIIQKSLIRVNSDPESNLLDDTVTVPGYGAMTLQQWITYTDWAIQAARDAYLEKDQTTYADAHKWLWAAGFKTAADIAAYRERRPLFDQPADAPHLCQCRVCGRRLSDPVSIAHGTGPAHRGMGSGASRAVA